MSSKRASALERAALPREVELTRAFRKDWERLVHSGRYDMRTLKECMLLSIANEAPLDPEWLDHPLKGEWPDCRECHIGGDFLLVYQLFDAGRRIHFVRAGSHMELFER